MRLRITARHRLAIHAGIIVLAIVVLRTPVAQTVLAGGLVEFADMTKQILRFPCWLFDHTHCFSLDRFDPACPQCL
jgi:hypothetical protein